MADVSNTSTMPGNRGCVACGASNPPAARFCAQCGASLPPVPGAAASKAASLVQDARENLTLQHWEEAALAAEAALALEPNSAEAHHIAAQARLKQGMRSTATRHAERAVALDPGNAEYHATLLAAQGPSGSAPVIDWSKPSVMATAAGLLVLVLVLIIGLNSMANRGARDAQLNITPSTPTGTASPFNGTPDPNAVYPQPNRATGTTTARPRVPARSSAPGPSELLDQASAAVPATTSPATQTGLPTTMPSAAVGLAPAPVDASPLNRFASAPPSRPAPQAPAQEPPVRTAPVVEPPSAQPGGTLFGGTGFGPDRNTNETLPASATPDETATAAPVTTAPARASTPQQAYIQRDYGAAIQGYLNRIDNGQATGSNYLQLGLTYERVGDRRNALAAYKAAAQAYQAQIQAGTDTDVASRGLRTTQRAIAMLGSR